MIYYTSTNKLELEQYNDYVSDKIGLLTPYRWAQIKKHPAREEWAIMKHEVHTSSSLTEAELDSTWDYNMEG